ncbi:carboxypeptidase-like regulatory domain-containing protein [Cylindrospermum sp. FACHB-282]|uniref:carboxypeptidase-like regulatory domain-containing protein n=1 Tax=Cylindrospermum sp. FACHB-282 TaxID=2692794 RepID=UPI0016880F9E|nr:carboxypeptidase-like regulatory domain-containing protein [Cylindrospermum sp. FACHB-282]MBD2387293.1 carboxypeptidase regulatory-like domain-containing protein [Cylindrospermum sp. FACHB-282]
MSLLPFAFYLLITTPVGANPPIVNPPIPRIPEGTNPLITNPPIPTPTPTQTIPTGAITPPVKPASPTTTTPAELPKDLGKASVFPVGLNLGKRNVNPSILVRGQEDGTQAINFDNWLLSYDDVIQALKLNVTSLPDGQLEVRTAGIVTRIDPKKIRTDPELGLVFSTQELQALFGVKAEFDINEYAIILEVPWLNKSSTNVAETETPIQLEGLPRIAPANFSLAAVEQKVNATGTQTRSPTYKGEFVSVGSAFGGSWFLRTNQRNFQDWQTWSVADAQFLRQTHQADYIVGSQQTFWQTQQTQQTGGYWGFTFIQRQGFVPRQVLGAGSTNSHQRLEAGSIGRTISGRAEPGTLVRLTQSIGDRVIAEVLVDSSGIYRFENIKNSNQFSGGGYRVLLYPQGRLTAQPEIRDASFSSVPGQLPPGASGLIVSGGLRHSVSDSENAGLLGKFSDFRGGIAQRWGLSENLTVGLGGIYDKSPRAMAELFYRPSKVPLQVAVSALTGDEWVWNADIRYDPTPSLSAAFISDSYSNRLNVNWRVFGGFTLFTNAVSDNGMAGGVQINLSGKNAFTFARASLDSKNYFRWNLLQRLGKMEFTQRGNEVGTLSEFSYNFSKNLFSNTGNSLVLNYETQNQNRSDKLLTVGWRYRSPQQAIDGNYLWEAQLGYGIASQGSGGVVTLSTTILPGLLLRGRYQGVTVTSDQASFSVDLVSSLGLQQGITPGDRRSEYFRTQGGLLIQPFFDRNGNGKRDAGEDAYTENVESLLVINTRSIKPLKPEVLGDRILLRLPPGTYRLDLDPAGFPPDWQATIDALAVDVVAGGYTPIVIPLFPAYTRSGVVTDAQGKAVAGARVEAIQSDKGIRHFSVTNGAGVYYLEGLHQGNYTLQINGKSVDSLKLQESSEPFQELNLQQP